MTTTTAPPRLAITAGPALPPDRRPAAPVVAAEGPVRGTADPGHPQLRGEQTRRLVPPVPAAPSDVLVWVSRAAGITGAEPVNVTVSAATHDAHIHLGTAADFRNWCDYLSIPPTAIREAATILGSVAEATTSTTGWALHVRLFGPAVQELS